LIAVKEDQVIRSFTCQNCRGPQVESAEIEETCPKCGGVMQGKLWDIEEIVQFSPRLKCQKNGCKGFMSIGSLQSQEPMLLSYAINREYLERAIGKANVAVLFVRDEDVCGIDTPISFVFSEHPQIDFFLFHNYLIEHTDFYGRPDKTSISPTAQVHPSAFVAEMNVVIDCEAVIGPNVTVLEHTIIGPGTVIAPGVVLGVQGARLIKRPDGSRFKALHGGEVRIGKNVFIGANAVVVRSVWRRPTTIGDGVFVGNLVNIGHNCQVSDGAMILPAAILCGRAEIGVGATVAPGAMVSNGVRVGDQAFVSLGAVVTQDVPSGQQVSGNFAIEHARLVEHIKELSAK